MQIEFTPVRTDTRLALERHGDCLIVNGERFDFAPLPEGAELPAEAIESDWFTGVVRRVNGVLHLAVRLPHGADAPDETLFPQPVMALKDGPVGTPPYSKTDTAKEAQHEQD